MRIGCIFVNTLDESHSDSKIECSRKVKMTNTDRSESESEASEREDEDEDFSMVFQ